MARSSLPLTGWLAAVCVLTVASRIGLAEVLFRDLFEGTSIDPDMWLCQDRNWPVGQTWFKGWPTVAEGIATFEHHTFNVHDSTQGSCLSQEICSKDAFPRGTGLEFKARVRVRTGVASGLVTSFFAYMDKEMATGQPRWNDEIDFEFLSNQINSPPETAGDRVVVTNWNDYGAPGSRYNDAVHHWSVNPPVSGLDLTQFNVFRFRWWPDHTEWFWEQTPGNDVLIYTTANALPDEPMPVRFNFWAATSDWPLAYDPSMRPTDDPATDVICYYDVDYVVVRTPCANATGDVNCDCAVDFDDINPFVRALVGQGPYEARHPDCWWLNADINGDGSADFDDINPFVKCLVHGGCP